MRIVNCELCSKPSSARVIEATGGCCNDCYCDEQELFLTHQAATEAGRILGEEPWDRAEYSWLRGELEEVLDYVG